MKRSWHQQFARKPKADRTSFDGIEHDSIAEMRRWMELRNLETRGLVRDLQRQVSFPLRLDADRAVKTPSGRIASYKPDFVYQRLIDGKWQLIIEDVKGWVDATAQLRIAIFEACYSVTVSIHKGKSR